MKWKSTLIKPFAKVISWQIAKARKNAVLDQSKIFHQLIEKGRKTEFGRAHQFDKITTYEQYQKYVPIRDYEEMKTYFDAIKMGRKDVLWPGKPNYLAKTSGTTSGVKYIPLTKESTPFHVNTARNAVFNYIIETGDASILDGKMIFLSGSPELSDENGIPTGRLSGIVNHQVPQWLKGNQLPSYTTNTIEDWEDKLEKIIDETIDEDMRMISGIPPWVQMYFERLLQRTGKQCIRDIFPNFSLFVYGGVNYEPYRSSIETLIGKSIASIETFPASEGFFAFQDTQSSSALLLNTNAGMFFEFMELNELNKAHPKRIQLKDVEIGKDYALIVSSNAGLWSYDVGDLVSFEETYPFRLRVAGRVKHFISAFGEHVIGKEVEHAMLQVSKEMGLEVVEFTVAPQVNPQDGKAPFHEWFVELHNPQVVDVVTFGKLLDEELITQNIYYQDLRQGAILRPAQVRLLKQDSFRDYMKSQGKLGGQNKVPRLSNNRKIVEALQGYVL